MDITTSKPLFCWLPGAKLAIHAGGAAIAAAPAAPTNPAWLGTMQQNPLIIVHFPAAGAAGGAAGGAGAAAGAAGGARALHVVMAVMLQVLT